MVRFLVSASMPKWARIILICVMGSAALAPIAYQVERYFRPDQYNQVLPAMIDLPGRWEIVARSNVTLRLVPGDTPSAAYNAIDERAIPSGAVFEILRRLGFSITVGNWTSNVNGRKTALVGPFASWSLSVPYLAVSIALLLPFFVALRKHARWRSSLRGFKLANGRVDGDGERDGMESGTGPINRR